VKLEDAGLTPAERATADKWMTQHKTTCPAAAFDFGSVVSGYGYRMKIYCTACGAREDISEVPVRDPYPHR
jgi:hypothetical protein